MSTKDINSLLGLLNAADTPFDLLLQKADRTFPNRADYYRVSPSFFFPSLFGPHSLLSLLLGRELACYIATR